MRIPFLPLLPLLLLIPPSLARTHPRPPRDWETLDDALLSRVARADPQPWTSVNEGHLGSMLVPRPAGSDGNAAVREYIRGVFERLGWHVEQDTFTGKTPEGDIEFTNLIATYDPEAERKVVLAAHHDSKWFPHPPESEFIGATDSAAPCAMLLDLAEFITPALDARRERLEEHDDDEDDDERDAARTTLQMVFFDGEEAFHDWTATDSIYGSRHLAERWESTFLPPTHPYHATHPKRRMDPNPTVLHTIEHLILLDLLGSAQPRILKWYRETGWLFDEMRRADERLRASGLVQSTRGDEWFSSQVFGGTIEDDQVPFIERGVNVFHVIPYPFPTVWHTIKDDATALDMPTMHRWNLILRVFTLEYLGLPPPPPVGASRQKRSHEEETHTHTRHREL
ncbi:hypothetical protein NliqN6_1867 [Naganishia liquefaciens]|uniref:Peptide hydrolase n=1 Tax=Naganishia liquefaciens TaxID=104408 RepID=A0A8H3YDI2_9TREE|nr:hypothetical protein NliqN6_1867 [Naganishia liquefaciens]